MTAADAVATDALAAVPAPPLVDPPPPAAEPPALPLVSPEKAKRKREVIDELPYTHRRTRTEIRRAKRLERTDLHLDEWDKFKYATRADDVCKRPIEYDSQTVPIPRIAYDKMTPEWFFENVASKSQPAIIEGGCAHWPAMKNWALEELEKKLRHVSFKVGEDDKGKKIKMKMKYFADYMRHQVDDNPLYLFETEIQDNAKMQHMFDDFQVPEFVPDDWLNLLNHDSRPPHRWWCIGPKRSGTTVHTDPLGTSAWNAVTSGSKRWVLFEPHVSKKVAKGKGFKEKDEDDEAIMYFDFLLPRIKKAHPEVRVYEGMQNAGDIIFVPGWWWHGVLNTEDCVAVTQNYCGPDNFEVVWKSIRRDREKVAYLWLRNMKKFAPELYERAIEMNRRDNFRMRHERKKGEKLEEASSSSSDSSDSSSDHDEDIPRRGLEALLSRGCGSGAGDGVQPRRIASPMSAQTREAPQTKEALQSHKHRRRRSRSRSRRADRRPEPDSEPTSM